MKAHYMEKLYANKDFKEGMKRAVPIFMGYFPISLTFGLIAKSAGLPGYMAVLMSMTNFTGATQFISVRMLVAGISVWNILLTTFMINARYLLMSFCVANKLPVNVNKKLKKILSFGITDEIFVLAMVRPNLSPDFMMGSQLIPWIGWVGGTILGTVIADILPEVITKSTGIAIYIMFLGLLLPAVKRSRKIAAITGIAVVISSVLFYTPFLKNIIGNWRIIITIIASASLGALLFPVEEEKDGF